MSLGAAENHPRTKRGKSRELCMEVKSVQMKPCSSRGRGVLIRVRSDSGPECQLPGCLLKHLDAHQPLVMGWCSVMEIIPPVPCTYGAETFSPRPA